MTERRNVVSHIVNGFENGWRESRKDADSPWVRDLHSDYVKNIYRFWFQKTPIDIMREDMGFATTMERANEFENASDNDPAVWYYLAAASPAGSGDEALKWIMGALATELNVQKKPFTFLPKLMPARVLAMFVSAISNGRIDRTFTKTIFSELLAVGNNLDIEAFDALIARPEYKAISADDLEPIIDNIIAENMGQFEKAKANPKLVQFFVGQVMKATQGKAPPPKVIEIMTRKLAG
jgi:Asp-tRNA(Asn)/Glu-tRNA(Gln) amidotransferase B subunit